MSLKPQTVYSFIHALLMKKYKSKVSFDLVMFTSLLGTFVASLKITSLTVIIKTY